MEHISTILERLLRTIPAPYKPPPRTRAQWQRLKVGDRLRTRAAWASRQLGWLDAGTVLEVTRCDEAGVSLARVEGASSLMPLRWEQPEWETVFERVRKPRVRKTVDGSRQV